MAIIGVTVYGIIMRYVFKHPTVYSLELLSTLFIALIALCLSYAQMGGRHIRVKSAWGTAFNLLSEHEGLKEGRCSWQTKSS